MAKFSFSKVDAFKSAANENVKQVIDIQFPNELKKKASNLLVFIADDDPNVLQALNSYFNSLELHYDNSTYQIIVKNFATGNSCISALNENPDLVLIDYYLNKSVPGQEPGRLVIQQIHRARPEAKIFAYNTDQDPDLEGVKFIFETKACILEDSFRKQLNKEITPLLA